MKLEFSYVWRRIFRSAMIVIQSLNFLHCHHPSTSTACITILQLCHASRFTMEKGTTELNQQDRKHQLCLLANVGRRYSNLKETVQIYQTFRIEIVSNPRKATTESEMEHLASCTHPYPSFKGILIPMDLFEECGRHGCRTRRWYCRPSIWFHPKIFPSTKLYAVLGILGYTTAANPDLMSYTNWNAVEILKGTYRRNSNRLTEFRVGHS